MITDIMRLMTGKMIMMKKISNSKHLCKHGESEYSLLSEEYSVVQLLWKSLRRFYKNLKIKSLYDPVIHSWTHNQETLSQHKADTCSFMFTTALFMRVQNWSQSENPSTDKWIRKCGLCSQWDFLQP